MNKKIIFKFFIISFLSTLSIEQLISAEEDKVPLLRSELRKRKSTQIENSNVDLQKTCVQEQALESHDEIFSSLGNGWDFFKQGNYEKAFNHIWLSSKVENYAGRYLLARFYEFGLVGKKDSILASKLYASVFAESNNQFLKSESEKGLARTLRKCDRRKEAKYEDFIESQGSIYAGFMKALGYFSESEENIKE